MVSSVAFHPSGTIVASASIDKSIKLFDIRTHKLIQHYGDAHGSGKETSGGVNSICFGGERGEWMISTGNDGLVKIWDLKEGHLLYTLYGHKYGATTAAMFSPNGDFFASGGADSQVMVWKSNLESLAKVEGAVPSPHVQAMHANSSRPHSRSNHGHAFGEPSVSASQPRNHPVADTNVHSAFGGVTHRPMESVASSRKTSPRQGARSPGQGGKWGRADKETVIAGQEYGNVSLTRPESPEIINVGAALFQEVCGVWRF
jgi:centriolar protein POC1